MRSVQSLRPNPYQRFKSKILGVSNVAAVRSNEGAAVSLLFRHSIVAVVEKSGVIPPNLTQLKRLQGCFSEPHQR